MPVPTPSGLIFEGYATTDKVDSNSDSDAHRDQMAKGADVAAQEAATWMTFGNELAELVGKLHSALGPLGGLTNLPTGKRDVFGIGTEIPRHGVNGEEMVGHLMALMRDSRAIGAAYEAAGRRLATALADHVA